MDEIKPQVNALQENEVLLKDNGEWLHFRDPYRLLIAEHVEEVLPALRMIEQLVTSNDWYAAGFLSYEAAPAFDAALQTRPANGFPYLWFGLYPTPGKVALPALTRPGEPLQWMPTTSQETYNAGIAQIKEHIAHGRTYQVNYTMRLETDFAGDAWEFFLSLAQQQGQHAAYINTGRYAICSASPELFFRLDGNTITCRPMKGTAQRGRTTAEDREQAAWLQASIKNRAENVMIVDMIRNDLGRIAEVASVSVPQLFETERYRTLWQMTSTVTARTSASLTDLFTALFPCASITGAPKVSTMQIIAELENTPRKIYTGAIGYVSSQRTAKFNVAIRTALIDRQLYKAEYGVGGGIVWDSTSTDEYAEALLKARVLTQPPNQFSLLETMRWTPEEGFFLLQRHIARLMDSADYFDIPITGERVDRYFQRIASQFHAPQRVRLLLDQAGRLSFEATPFAPEAAGTLQVCLARDHVDSANVFLYHKTTYRDAYERARKGLEQFDDVLLYNESGELTEFTIGNVVLELDGKRVTPPLYCGVLAGTFRAHLLETGQVVEQKVTVPDLTRCSRVFRVNSVRGWQEVKFPDSQAF